MKWVLQSMFPDWIVLNYSSTVLYILGLSSIMYPSRIHRKLESFPKIRKISEKNKLIQGPQGKNQETIQQYSKAPGELKFTVHHFNKQHFSSWSCTECFTRQFSYTTTNETKSSCLAEDHKTTRVANTLSLPWGTLKNTSFCSIISPAKRANVECIAKQITPVTCMSFWWTNQNCWWMDSVV